MTRLMTLLDLADGPGAAGTERTGVGADLAPEGIESPQVAADLIETPPAIGADLSPGPGPGDDNRV